ncbi:FixH family protein [Sphingomonas sp. HDW15A]|uniref:FixH family protein n=1 Tax=Sphingomonas sp. HDW15A TaxID=2714942 RepID=UPI00140A8C01|nr:FixH family protein [Sphingomonas sp. HDW15A]QIK95758.1 FixH family protein [Sphingomonas sp. HDW15A]
MTNRFTGWHMFAILVVFFGIVIAVNVWLAVSARTTFGGTLAENGYVASQDYNKWIAASAAQDRLGWSVKTAREGGRLVLVATGVDQPDVTVLLRHPLGREPERLMSMRSLGDGRFESIHRLPEGRWRVHIDLAKGNNRARFLEEVRQ